MRDLTLFFTPFFFSFNIGYGVIIDTREAFSAQVQKQEKRFVGKPLQIAVGSSHSVPPQGGVIVS
jgi:hypothetical protein